MFVDAKRQKYATVAALIGRTLPYTHIERRETIHRSHRYHSIIKECCEVEASRGCSAITFAPLVTNLRSIRLRFPAQPHSQ